MPQEATTVAEVLSSPWKIYGLTIKNRFVLSPMAVLQPTKDGHPSDQTIAFLTARARGGAGLLIIGGGVATERGNQEAPFQPLMRFDRDEFIPGLKRMVDAVHEHGVPIFAQIFPSFGAMGVPGERRPTRAASPKPVRMAAPRLPHGFYIPGGLTNPTPVEITKEEILEVQDQTVAATLRAKAAGFDGIELGAHMRYLYSSFLSPRTNWRTDEYGGSAENRARILTDTVRAIRAEVGADYPVGLRMSVNDHLPDGQGPEGFAETAAIIAKEGVGYIALTDGNYESMDDNLPSSSGSMLAHAEPQAFRAALPNVPLLLSSTYDPQQSADAIANGHGDGIMLARQLLADPEFPNKVLQGRLDEIVWCDHDNSCLRRLIFNVPVRCHKNPAMGREAALEGAREPVSVKLKRPAEALLIAATGSPTLMGIADRLASSKSKASRN
ncbi:NADH:flavin oxidoreductase [Arthrobacter sp. I2-34]|uniref:NADH:flavin oxidoreductase n=1 Tax=Arthrobacter hankyongi TaxID=2904801 RepID=A0ABS9L5R4_9MICC|nr:NADH:flavin oxidoreductase [Arthrobacter hankyongi]MCG2621980.1 NADH:flavin oxidoreductase [Arthrobacter hankyongi]